MAEMKWFLLLTIFIPHTSSQLPPTPRIERISTNGTGICKGGVFRYIKDLEYLRGCTVVLGNLAIMLETAKADDFQNLTFRDLKEITDYMVIYRVRALESLGQLFPNLTRIRGERLLNNFALIVYDIPNLREIGLYRLLKIDRGGVIMWGLPQACFVDTIDWKALAPKARRVISLPETQTQCNIPCSCASKEFANKCWNNVICQLFLDGPDAEKCNDQCIGCRKTKNHVCFVCRHYTYNDTCVSKCPLNTIILPDNQYCITNEECIHLDRMVWNGTCIPECPMDYKESKNKGMRSCEPCANCQKTCRNLVIQSLSSIQDAGRCVYVNGSITIHVQAIPGALSDLKKNLGQIQEIAHYLAIEGSHMLTSLNFLSSLRTIKGEKLIENKYSLKITHNNNLQTLFPPDVLKNLVIKRGTAKIDQNPELCTSKIDEIRSKFLKAPTSLDIPETSNGFRGGCKEITFEFQIRYTSDTSVVIMLSPVTEYEFHYLALYARLPPGIQTMTVPETCNEFEWDAKDISTIPGEEFAIVELDSLQLASTYALCIELYDPIKQRLTRSNLFNFTTPVGIPKPPFIFELVASSSNIVVIRWVNHKEYANHITHYELDVALIEMNQIESNSVDYCKDTNDFFDTYYTRHAFVRRPPPGYKRVCESKCGVLSTVTPGAMIEDYFDICEDDHFQCTNKESVISKNTKFGNYIRTLILNITDLPKDCSYQVSGLAPYSDYKFRLRACSGNQCSRSDRGVVRTFPSRNADKITISSVQVSESGHVTVEWDPPKVNNGPILSYTINVMPRIGISSLIPQSWCVPANTTKMIVKSVITQEYLVTVCVKSLGSSKTCCEWIPVAVINNKDTKSSWLLLGVVCGILIYISSLVIGWLIKRRGSRVYSDVTALIDSTSFSRAESEILSPGLILSDFVPFHSIPLD